MDLSRIGLGSIDFIITKISDLHERLALESGCLILVVKRRIPECYI